jgi:hypothetical protein
MKVGSLISGILLFAYNICFCQSPVKAREEFAKIKEAYDEHKSFSFDVKVVGYKTPTDKTPEIIGKGTTKKGNGFKYSRFDDVECIQHENNTLYIDHSYKIISYYEYTKKRPSQLATPSDMTSVMDSIWKRYDTVLVYKGVENNLKHFVVSNQTDQIKQSDLYFNAGTNLLEKVVYYYNTNNENYEPEYSSVITYYGNYNYNNPSAEACNTKKFIMKNGNEFKPTLAYKEYKVQYYDLTKRTSKH